MTTPHRILMTIALPYANGDIHLGHMVEAIQADIWAHFQKLRGNQCIFICGNDAHGTAIMLSAQKQGISPEELIKTVQASHQQDFKQFLIEFDNFHTTHSPENKKLVIDIYQKLKARGDIVTREITQYFDPTEKLFLADRFIKGECPKCGAKDQYGDNCEVCGATYSPTELKNPYSAISGATPIEKQSTHYFFCLEHYADMLQQWISSGHLQPQVANKLKEWFDQGLQPWDISRDAPYFGFKIPDTEDKYFYVWLDAPVGYMASLKHLSEQRDDIDFDEFWRPDSDVELFHFVGKDIVYFHALFWPAMLEGAGLRKPNAIFVHGFLTINGEKMSKSRGTFVTAKCYLQHLHPEYLRYYFAAKLSNNVEDIDLNFEDFAQRVNADLVGKYVNLASRCAGFITKHFNSTLSNRLHDEVLYQTFTDASESIAKYYENLDYSHAIREIMSLADKANQYIDQYKPWTIIKEPGNEVLVQQICTQGLNLFCVLTLYLKPILPNTSAHVENFLNIEALRWDGPLIPLLEHRIHPFNPLMQRITSEQIAALIAESAA